VDGDELPLTHECLSLMPAVRRAGATEAIHLLEGAGIVTARRAIITIIDRERLEEPRTTVMVPRKPNTSG
jgi:hypothetical protein